MERRRRGPVAARLPHLREDDMPYQNLSPAKAKELLDGPEGWTYVDVRTEGEFGNGHPPHAHNVPLAIGTPPQMQINPEFLAVMKANFKKDARLVVGCASGARSAKACEILVNAGYSTLVNMASGFMGSRDAFGNMEKGWASLGLPTEKQAKPEQTYDQLRRKV
jgi:rhodanese-related sulfurtransferase